MGRVSAALQVDPSGLRCWHTPVWPGMGSCARLSAGMRYCVTESVWAGRHGAHIHAAAPFAAAFFLTAFSWGEMYPLMSV